MINIELDNLSPMYSKKELFKILDPYRGGIYFLYDKYEELIYIGRSKQLHKRLADHVNGRTHTKYFHKEIKYIKIMYVNSITEQKIYEIYAIAKYCPKYNEVDVPEDSDIAILTEKEIGVLKLADFVSKLVKANKHLPMSIVMIKEFCRRNEINSKDLLHQRTLEILKSKNVILKNDKFVYSD